MPLLLSGKRTNFVRPVIAIRDIVIYPSLNLPLTVGRPKSVEAVTAAQHQEYEAVVVAQRDNRIEDPKPDQLFAVGTLVRIQQILRGPSDSLQVHIEGKERVKIIKMIKTEPYLLAEVEPIAETAEESTEIEALKRQVLNQFGQIAMTGRTMPAELAMNIFNTSNLHRLVELITVILNPSLVDRQQLLEAEPLADRFRLVLKLLSHELEVQKLGKRIEEQAHHELGKLQREVLLREQMKAIQKELGGESGDEFSELEKKIRAAEMPVETQKHALKELDRLRKMPSFGPEVSYLRTYLDWLVILPWKKRDETKIDLKAARRTLDHDHSGLDKVKERILEFLAVQKLASDRTKLKAQILCFVGPPGVGKTSIGRSVASALGRKFIRISLGGIRDEAEIRGHRRTYVGAMPGRIIQAIRQVGTKNPVFMFDEIDKIGADFRGDPSAALLEALDPEQNRDFTDHYLEVPFDLSEVFFIATANTLETIPPALLDRMEVITYPGYTEDEKYQIAHSHLLAKVIEGHGLKKTSFHLSGEAIRAIIRFYTREAGVRDLERQLATIARKVARQLAEGKSQAKTITERTLKRFLGPERYQLQVKEQTDQVGVVQGLAVTYAGGDVLTIEVTKMPGKGGLILTGQLGDVMKESAQAAMSYARSRATRDGVDAKLFTESDWHVHVPAGAIPKDGPSAGVALATALYSVASNRLVKSEVAMTGEVTLRGRVLGVGGIKEKVLAAHRAGIRTIFLPEENKKDLEELPRKVRKELDFIFASNMDQILDLALT